MFLKWNRIAKVLTRQIALQVKEAKDKAREIDNNKNLEVLNQNLSEQKDGILLKQIESLLYATSIDCVNGFINL